MIIGISFYAASLQVNGKAKSAPVSHRLSRRCYECGFYYDVSGQVSPQLTALAY